MTTSTVTQTETILDRLQAAVSYTDLSQRPMGFASMYAALSSEDEVEPGSHGCSTVAS